ncbi:SET domain-containing protein 3, partial [Coemansia erecta]
PYAHFHPGIDICVDARRQGSEARFIRRSCSANVVLKSMYISGSANPLVYLGLFAQRDVEPDEELTLGWEWEDGELPALARMSPSDAEDYLGRPEGRRLSKVWRQAFAGVSCACPDQQCEVRRLFTLLNVEELSAKPEIGRPLKRRTSRTAKPDSIASDIVNQSPPSPSSSNIQSQSLDDHTPIRGSHSRKGSAASGVLNGRTLREASVEVESNSNVSVRSSSQLGHSLASRDANASRNSEVLHDSDDANSDNNYGVEKSNGQPDNASDSPYEGTDVTESALAGSGDLNQRKRKLSGQSLVDPIAPTDLESRNGNSSKAHRLSVSSVSSRRTPQSTALPLKKLWMNKYLEGCSEPRIISQDGENMTIAEDPPLHTTNLAATQPAQGLKRGGSISRRSSVYEEPREPSGGDRLDTADSGPEKTEPHTSSTAENGRNIIKSEPTDADAPTPPPTNSPPPGLASLEQDVTTAQVLVDSAASDSKPMPHAADADSSTQNKDQIAPNAPEGITETNPNVAQRTDSLAAEKASIPPPKKQRLSLQEYNKRRRVNNPTVSSKEAESKDVSIVNTPEATSAPATSEEPVSQMADHSMATNDGSVLAAPVAVRPTLAVYTEAGAPSRGESATPPPPPALLASSESVMSKRSESMSSQQRASCSPKLADSPAARSLSSSLPPSMIIAEIVPGGGGSSSASRADERPRSSTGYSNGTRIERSSTGTSYDAGSAYRSRERDFGHRDTPGSVERESGEIAHRRERMRS